MIKANYSDREKIVEILANSFATNKSVNYLASTDKNRIRALMYYSFDICNLFGDVFMSDDRKACALILYPDKKKTTLKSVFLDAKLVFCIGLARINKILTREAKVKSLHPKATFYYLWFIGVDPMFQRKGIGTALLQEIIKDSKAKGRIIHLETSTPRNIQWYKELGFEIYNDLELPYKLFFIRKP